MNQADLIAAVAAHASLTKADAGKAVEALVGTITEALKRGEEVRIAGFGTFGISERGERRAAILRPARRSRSPRPRLPGSPPARPSRTPSTAEPVGTVLPRPPRPSDRGWIQEVFAEGRRC